MTGGLTAWLAVSLASYMCIYVICNIRGPGTPHRPKAADHRRESCVVCEAENARDCTCGADLADEVDATELASFIRFVRAPTTPVYSETDPEDQRDLQIVARRCMSGLPGVSQPGAGDLLPLCRNAARFAAVAALSGRPDAISKLESVLGGGGADPALVEGIRALCDAGPFFRGGQAHGPLKKSDVPKAVEKFISTTLPSLAEAVHDWCRAAQPPRDSACGATQPAVRRVMELIVASGKIFQCADYFNKRCMEILLLTGLAGVEAKHLDALADIWPLGEGTKAGLKIIFPTARPSQFRPALRVLQRALGGGTRRVTLVRISAFLCFYKRANCGTLPWPVSA